MDATEYLCPTALFAEILAHIDQYNTDQLMHALHLVYLQMEATSGENELLDLIGVFSNYQELKKKENTPPAIIQALEEHINSASIHVKSLLKEICWNWLYHANSTDLIELFRKKQIDTFSLTHLFEDDTHNAIYQYFENRLLAAINDKVGFMHWDMLSIEPNETKSIIKSIQEEKQLPDFPYSPIMVLPFPGDKKVSTLLSIKKHLTTPFNLIKKKIIDTLEPIRGKSFIEDYPEICDKINRYTKSNQKNEIDISLYAGIKEHFEKIYSGKKGYLISYTLHLAPISSIASYFILSNTLPAKYAKRLDETLKEKTNYESWTPILTSNLVEFEGLKDFLKESKNNN